MVPEPSQAGRFVVLGAGPAGLTTAYLLARDGHSVTVLESQSRIGGLARTHDENGFRFDLGPHRFFTKSAEVSRLWSEMLGADFQRCARLTRIHWNGRFLDYPLRGTNVISKLGPVELTRVLGSYLVAAVRPSGGEENYEQWVSNRFGRRLYELFFHSYTEKVWGVPPSEIRAEWAAQRIKTLSFWTAARAAFLGSRNGDVTSLISKFHYPRLGAGQMWETMAERIRELGGEVRLETPVRGLDLEGGRIAAVQAGSNTIRSDQVISSLPLRDVVGLVGPGSPPVEVERAAAGLRYRDLISVALIVKGADPFPDNWLYIHEPDVKVARIQNPRAFSRDMVPDAGRSCLVHEYFCFEGDELWRLPDADLVRLAASELDRLGLARADQVERGHVIRVPKAYPMYDADYAERVTTIRAWLEGIENLQQVGRNGLHRYNNQDHSMLTAMRAVENLTADAEHDIWAVNAESVYHEEEVKEEQPYRRAPATPAMEQPVADLPTRYNQSRP